MESVEAKDNQYRTFCCDLLLARNRQATTCTSDDDGQLVRQSVRTTNSRLVGRSLHLDRLRRLTMQTISTPAHVFTIGRVIEILGKDEHPLWDLAITITRLTLPRNFIQQQLESGGR